MSGRSRADQHPSNLHEADSAAPIRSLRQGTDGRVGAPGVGEDHELLAVSERNGIAHRGEPVQFQRTQSSRTELNLGGSLRPWGTEGKDARHVLLRYLAEYKMLKGALFASHWSGDGCRAPGVELEEQQISRSPQWIAIESTSDGEVTCQPPV